MCNERLEKAEKAIKQSVVTGIIVTIISFVVTVFAITSNSSGAVGYYNDPLNFIDVILLGLLILGLYKKSRLAATALPIYYISSLLIQYFDTGGRAGFLSVIFLIFFIRCTYYTYTYHRVKKETDPTYKAFNKKLYWIFVPGLSILFFIITFSMFIASGILPDTKVLSWSEINPYQFNILVDEGIVVPDDSIIYFYSAGLFSIREGGQLITADKVVTYWTENDTLYNYSVSYPEIKSMQVLNKGSWLEDSIIELLLYTDEYMYLAVSSEEGRDSLFYLELIDNWKQSNDVSSSGNL